MGHVEGKGLGKNQQGRAEIIEASKQKGRRGLGSQVKGFEAKDVDWDASKDEVTVDETVSWIETCSDPVPSIEEMRTWMLEGPNKKTIDDETEFCNPDILRDILSCKSVFDHLEGEEMRKARTRSNPYELIKGVFFQNRAAMKMANMDAVLDFCFTEPRTVEGRSLVQPNELLYFADVCAGPGGFSEYVLWRKAPGETKGFGFTLKGNNDFKLEDFYSTHSEFFEPHYGKGGMHGDGDVYNPENLMEFQEFVLNSTDQKGVHFVMADGGFSVDGQENIQEVLSKRLYLCQFLAAMMILRPGGHFVCKLFDVFTPFSVGLTYLMHRAFHRVSLFKPVTSRPANSERYIICQNKRSDSLDIQTYFWEINLRMHELRSCTSFEQSTGVQHVVPLEMMKQNEAFFSYVVQSNHDLGHKQIISLAKIQTYAQNEELQEYDRQVQIRDQCLEKWKIPNNVRKAPERAVNLMQKLQALLNQTDLSDLLCQPVMLTADNLSRTVHSVHDYRCMVVGSKEPVLLLSKGKSAVMQWNGRVQSRWERMHQVNVELPRDTVVLAERVEELKGEGRGQRKVTAVHIIDGLVLCGTDIRHLHFRERIEKLRKFMRAISRPSRSDLAPIRVKETFRLEHIGKVLTSLEMRRLKSSGLPFRLCHCCHTVENGQSSYMIPAGISLYKTMKVPWMMAATRGAQAKLYFYNTETRKSQFDFPPEAQASYESCQKTQLFWEWGQGVVLNDEQQRVTNMNHHPDKVSGNAMIQYVHEKLNPKK
ncbi:hypothetical protein CAPTEDRAFT_154782 [Capitella teleta]|uniref:Cap-specific mRNA (nucleoside-2'-O-)-methyltransferase 1 n=1 Tax=Capitella teleta TaxID=283909 RepID=R7TWQ8_CAPTE|nr:hypothetical protein CAPTEDRAFT_154782 [Capitella teleta]|eukprot:ELT98047.1 hypothetical protein CAPTEDRAFT_154782 [Capitella teleta]